MSVYTRIYILRFPKDIVDQPIICQLVKQFDVEFNILKATILPQHEGVMILELRGHKDNIKKGLGYLKSLDVKSESVATSIHRDDERCFQCGACTALKWQLFLTLKNAVGAACALQFALLRRWRFHWTEPAVSAKPFSKSIKIFKKYLNSLRKTYK
jgi:hypothetical protein